MRSLRRMPWQPPGSRALIGKTSLSTSPAASSAATPWRFGIWMACLRPPRESNVPGRCSRSFPAWGNRGRSIGARGCAPACRVHSPPACHGAPTARTPRPRAFQSSRLVCHSHPHRARAQILPRNENKAAGEAALFSDEWSEEKSLERFEEYPFNYSKSRIYLSSIRNKTHRAEAFRKSQNASALEAR